MSKKKEKQTTARRAPTKHQLSKWQRQQRINRIITIGTAVFLVGILSFIGHGCYNDNIKPLRQTVIEVNDTSFDMGYYVDMLDAQTKGSQPSQFSAQYVATQIEQMELMKQGARDLEIEADREEVKAKIKELDLPDSNVYRDLVTAELLQEKLTGFFTSQLPEELEQAHTQIMLTESQDVANNVIHKLEGGEDFAALTEEFSCNPELGGDQGWLPPELMYPAIGDIFSTLEDGEITTACDKEVTKNVGYWLIKITEKDEEKGIFVYTMLLPSEEAAREVRDKLEGGADFAELAEEYSLAASKDAGGELGWIKEGDSGNEAFDNAAFNLELNEISEPVKDESISTEGGYWVVQVFGKEKREPDDKVKMSLANREFSEWMSAQEQRSTINNYLDEEMISWAVQKVLQRR